MSTSVFVVVVGVFEPDDVGQIEVYKRLDVAALRAETFPDSHTSLQADGELAVIIELRGQASIRRVWLADSADEGQRWAASGVGGDGEYSSIVCSRLVDDPYWAARHAALLDEESR
jgi:hypothetical protein